jgi:hypothetical protein
MKADYFSHIHCGTRASLIEIADRALCELMDDPKKVISAAIPIVTEF